jgi:hypothetical protein
MSMQWAPLVNTDNSVLQRSIHVTNWDKNYVCSLNANNFIKTCSSTEALLQPYRQTNVWSVCSPEEHLLNLLCPSICMHETTWEILGGSSWNLVFDNFIKYCPSYFSFNLDWTILTSVHENLHVYLYIFQYLLEWTIFSTKGVEENETHILCSEHFSTVLTASKINNRLDITRTFPNFYIQQ